MAGRELTRRIHVALTGREDEIWEHYINTGSIKKTAAHFDVSVRSLYSWINDEPSRFTLWQDMKALRARVSHDEALEAADAATPRNATAQRLKADILKWSAERQDPQEFGAKQHISVVKGSPNEWLEAMRTAVAPVQGEDDDE